MKYLICIMLFLTGFVFLVQVLPVSASSSDIIAESWLSTETVGEAGFGQTASLGGGLYAQVSVIIKAAISLIGVIITFIIVYAGFLWMTAGGNADQIKKAKQWIINSIIGMAIILSAYAITDFVFARLIGRAMVDNYQEGGIHDECWNADGSRCD